jgi:histidine triad (HIT) family protein
VLTRALRLHQPNPRVTPRYEKCGRRACFRSLTAREAAVRMYTDSAMSCLFCKIIEGQIPSTAVYQDELVYAFADISPKAPVHILIVPREHIRSVDEADESKRALLGHLLWAAAKIARDKGLGAGYRIVLNTGEDGGQTVDHLHLHLLGGRSLTWPPG